MATTIAPEGVPPENVNARRTESIDAPSILALVEESTTSLFGRVNVVNVIEKAVLAVTLCNDREEILGHAAFFDYPNQENVDQAEWQQWINQYYDCTKCTPLNSLFMHYFVAKKEYAHGCAREIVRTAFNAVPDVHFLFLCVPIGSFPEYHLADIYKPMQLTGEKSPGSCAVFLCNRHEHVPVVHVRQARVEDHDDLTPIFNRQSDMLNMTYGNYFLAELIEAQDENMHCLVSEVDGTAYGFMSISNDVNYDLLNECFELGPFHGLRKPHAEDITQRIQTPVASPPPQDDPPSRQSTASSKKEEGTETDMSKVSESIKESVKEEEKSEEKKESTESKQSSGRTSRVNSNASDVKIKPKLSDAHMGSSGSLADQGSDVGEQQEDGSGKTTPVSNGTVPSPKPPTQPVSRSRRFVPTYKGENNAFSIQLFCIDERYEMRSSDFLAKAFAQFPDREFCVITVPHMVPEFPLLQSFVRVTPRAPSILSQELYVFHRNGLLKDFKVRLACKTDYSGIETLVKNIEFQENLLKDLTLYNNARRDDDGTEIKAFVAESQSQIVGVAIVRVEEDIEYIRSHYNIEDFIYYNHHNRSEHGRLHHFALNPMFSHQSKHFLKELLRIGHKTCLYYPLFPPHTDSTIMENYSLISCLKEMVPVRHRRQILYPLEKLGINAPSNRVLATREPYALNHINRKLTLEPKVTINARIVVVGASDVGIGFLEALAYCPHLQFNNLTLISPHGLPSELPTDNQRDLVLSNGHCYSHDEHAKIALQAWVNVVYGSMTSIDRKRKVVKVNNDASVPYDHLILCTGQQYQEPMPTDADIQSGVTNANLPNSPDRRFMGVRPTNCLTINDAYDAAVALYSIENDLVKNQKPAIVYGSTIDAYTCIQTLMSMGLSGDKIFFVQPPPQYETTCFNDPAVEGALSQALKDAGVQIYTGYYLAQWNDGRDWTEITSASFTSADVPLTLECSAFFSYYRKNVDFTAFKAINDACLVYDGKLVIDAYFHTNDMAIRGAGSLTKFQRKYHAAKWDHSCFNSKEVGVHLATEMLRLFDPTLEQQPAPADEQLNLIPIYRNPKIQGGVLPGNFHYLHVKKPGLDKPLIEQMGQADYISFEIIVGKKGKLLYVRYPFPAMSSTLQLQKVLNSSSSSAALVAPTYRQGRELSTGSPGGEKEYFRLHINQYNSLETITCLSKKPFSSSNLICLYALHERCLNNMVSRYDEGLIKDLYGFFNETWALSLYHDRFADFRDELRELLITRPTDGSESLEERVRSLIDPEMPLSETQRGELTGLYQQTGAKRAVEARLLNFLSYNYYHLPMYAKPGMV